ncbi:sialidase family protein [Tautonia sociabilis]|uniref:Exo-alpha-sialidase n=1 Tax=Tautonia sociabilis TaxID=2080755 RepID=A0A432MHS5_9BACT|nr:sialidase family protein [Tautonia sociabilis]RUL86912.1 exo-alpha-sialidase [Tautonia sociabilis]
MAPSLDSVLVLVLSLCLAPVEARGEGPEPAPPPEDGKEITRLDLSDQDGRRVVVDREEGQYLGHPTTVLLEDGRTMIAVYPKGHGRGPIVMKRSVDGGLTWSDRLPTPENWASSQETPTIHRVIDAEGKRRLILFSGLYPIRMAVSEDDGESWSPLEPIGDFGGIVAMSSVERLADGSYLALFHDDGRFLTGSGRACRFRVFATRSADGGLTWGPPEVIAEHPEAHLCEPGLIRSPDGRRIAVLLRENSRRFPSFVIVSDDEGKTWSEPREVSLALTGDRHVGKYAPDGRLFISFRDTAPGSPTLGDWVAWVGTFDDIIQGRSGQYRVRLMDNTKGVDCAYPGVEVLPDGTIVTTTYGHWDEGEPPYIVSIRLSLSELDAMADREGASPQGESAPESPTDR